MNVALPTRCLSLFSGYAGLDLALELAAGCRTVCYVEREAFAASVLVARMEDKALGDAPVWDDVSTFDGRPWRGVVDCVAGGSPCQDLSVAGKRAGLNGERSGLWREMLRIIRETSPAWVFWENVGGAVASALDVVTEDLEGLGFRVAPCTLAASDVGAPHERLRLFVLAFSDPLRQSQREGRKPDERGWFVDGRNAELGNASGAGRGPLRERDGGALREAGGTDAGKTPFRASGAAAVAHSSGERWGRTGRGASGDATHTGTFRWPPGPGSPEWQHIGADAQPAFRRGVDGAPAGMDSPFAFRNDRLRCLGNGVVPQQAAAAFLVCLGRLLK